MSAQTKKPALKKPPSKGRDFKGSTMIQGRQYAVSVDGTVITFECKRAGHTYKINMASKRRKQTQRLTPSQTKFHASWWSKAKGGCIGACPKCEAAERRAKKAEAAISDKTPIEGVFLRNIMLHVCKDGTLTYRDKTKREPVFNGVALPVFSVDTIEEAKRIQTRFCRLQYGKHPHSKGPEQWYTLTQFSGELDDLDRVMAEFATFWAEHIRKTPEAKTWARKLRYQLVDKLKRQAAGAE
jgi:hypothetical protein